MGDSSKKSDFATATAVSEGDRPNSSTTYFSTVEEQIEQSKAHWSTLVDRSSYTEEEEVDFEVSNEQEFRALQRHPAWGSFFVSCSGDGKFASVDDVVGELKVGKKFAEGGQAELYEAKIRWKDSMINEQDHVYGIEYVLKVFKEETLLKYVKYQLPHGLLRHLEEIRGLECFTPKRLPMYTSYVLFGLLLKYGRFAFLMEKCHFDLRTLIERNVKSRSEEYGPFSKEDAECVMYDVALGVEWLHNRDIVHRDLKASNVLVKEEEIGWRRWNCYVADYECSVGVIGTNFFRAPEILQACKERNVNERPEVFSRAADVYGYAMICYEILTGKLPFEDHPLRDSPSSLIDLVTNHHLRPTIPTYIEDWIHELLNECWQFDPKGRPGIGEVLKILSTNSAEVRRFKFDMKKEFGDYFRS